MDGALLEGCIGGHWHMRPYMSVQVVSWRGERFEGVRDAEENH